MNFPIVDLAIAGPEAVDAAAGLLVDSFEPPAGWSSKSAARADVRQVLDDGFALAALDGSRLIGWIGGLPGYSGRVWELHPMVVDREFRLLGIGRALVDAFEAEVARRGGITITLGTDDESGKTSLAGIDLYEDLPAKLGALRDLGRRHPFLFYRKLGYVVTGVLPDANGVGRPDIFMSKRVS